jgi:hypothetical protein
MSKAKQWPRLWHWRQKFGSSEMSVWLLVKAAQYSTEEVYTFERELRIYLLRLHSEHVVLRRGLKVLASEEALAQNGAASFDVLQQYFNDSIGRLGRFERHTREISAPIGNAELVARSYFSKIAPGELDAVAQRLELLSRRGQMRGNIRKKIIGYAESITTATVNQHNYYIGGIAVGDTYSNLGQAVNVGPNGTATNVTQNQLNRSNDEAAKQLLSLAEHMKETAQTPEEKFSVSQWKVHRLRSHRATGRRQVFTSKVRENGLWMSRQSLVSHW